MATREAFDAKQFKTFNCVTCHGNDGADRKVEMPSNDIRPLPSTPQAFQVKRVLSAGWPTSAAGFPGPGHERVPPR
jgi:hypothetical protein